MGRRTDEAATAGEQWEGLLGGGGGQLMVSRE